MGINLDRPFLRHLVHGTALITRGMTLGVRGIAIDDRHRVCLVRHTYVRGWHLPGGGIEPGETAAAAMAREFREEAEIALDPATPLRLLGFCLNTAHRGRDHIAVFRTSGFQVLGPKKPDREIAECRFFPLDDLPSDTSRGTRERLREVQDGRAVADTW